MRARRRFAVVLLPAGLLVAGIVALRRNETSLLVSQIPAIEQRQLHLSGRTVVESAHSGVHADPANAASWGHLGVVYMAHECYPEALTCFEVAHRLDEDDVRWVYFAGVILEQSDLQGARSKYEQAVLMESETAPIVMRLSIVCMRLGDLEGAAAWAEQGMERDPVHAGLIIQRGRVARLQGNLPEAVKWFRQAMGAAPLHRQLRIELAQLYRLQGDNESAIESERQALAYSDVPLPNNDPYLLQVQRFDSTARSPSEQADQLAAAGQQEAAARIYQQLIREFPELSGPRLSLAHILLQAGKLDEAENAYRDLTRHFPQEPLAWLGLGIVFRSNGRDEEALAAFDACVRLKPDFTDAHLHLGLMQQQLGNRVDARAAFERALAASPDSVEAHLLLGQILVDDGNSPAGLSHLETAARLAPSDQTVQAALMRFRDGNSPIPQKD